MDNTEMKMDYSIQSEYIILYIRSRLAIASRLRFW